MVDSIIRKILRYSKSLFLFSSLLFPPITALYAYSATHGMAWHSLWTSRWTSLAVHCPPSFPQTARPLPFLTYRLKIETMVARCARSSSATALREESRRRACASLSFFVRVLLGRRSFCEDRLERLQQGTVKPTGVEAQLLAAWTALRERKSVPKAAAWAFGAAWTDAPAAAPADSVEAVA
jgi:hypothetical protein